MQRKFASVGPQTGHDALFDDIFEYIPGKDESRLAEVHKKRKGAPVLPIAIFLALVVATASCAAYMIYQNGLDTDPAQAQSDGLDDPVPPVDDEPQTPPENPTPDDNGALVLKKPEDEEPKDDDKENPDKEQTGDDPIDLPNPADGEDTPPATSGETNAKAEYAYFDDAVFIGDSLTQGLDIYGKIPNASYIASQGINPQTIHGSIVLTDGRTVTVMDELMRVPHKKIYIMLGSNGVAWMSKQTIVDYYTQLLTTIQAAAPESTIYVQSILPVTAGKSQDERYSNSKIRDYNTALEQMAKDQGVYYLDVAQALKNENGDLPSEAAPSDGMHMSAPYYQKWVDYLLNHTAQDPAAAKEEEEKEPESKETVSSEDKEAKEADKKLTLSKDKSKDKAK